MPSACVSASTTFFRVSAAVYGPFAVSSTALLCATSVSMVGVFGESKTTGAASASKGTGSAGAVLNASTFAAYPPADRTKVSSPIAVGCRNSSLRAPPISPLSAATMTYSRPRRWKMRSYASRWPMYEASWPASV